MDPRFRMLYVFFVACMGVFFLTPQIHAAKPIANVSSFKGEVIILSGNTFVDVRAGMPLMHGDRIQTKEGEVEITFSDGALMKVRKYTSTMIQEREMKKGFWFFERKKLVRRISCFVGSLRFKSGTSKRKNYIQTPTAVCGLRGTTLDAVFNNVIFYVSLAAGTPEEDITLKGAAELVPDAVALFKQLAPKQLARYSGIYRALDGASIQPDVTRLTLIATYMALEALIGNEHISQAERDLLAKALELVKLELEDQAGDAVQEGFTDEEIEKIKEEVGTPEWMRYLEKGSHSGHGPDDIGL